MSTHRSWRAAAWCLAAFLLQVAIARAADFNYNVPMESGASADIRLTVPGGRIFHSGFMPVRVRIANRGGKERTWRLTLNVPGAVFAAGVSLNTKSAFSFTVPGGETSEFMVWAPLAAIGNNRGGATPVATVEGPEVREETFVLSLNAGWGSASAPVALDPALEESLTKVANTELPMPATTPRSGRSYLPRPARTLGSMERVSVIDPAAWPADWRLWSAFPLVILRQETWTRIGEARRHAVEDWVAMGGRLVLVPDEEQSGVERAPLGAGEVLTLERPLQPQHLPLIGFFDTARNSDAAGLARPALWDLKQAEWQLRPKVRWLTAFVLVFGLAVGPANLFFFAPAGRRHRLFLTVPLISFAGAVLLFAAIMISDGFGGEGTRRSLVLLLPERNEAVIQQLQVSRTGLLGRREFALPADVLFDRVPGEMPQGNGGFWREGDKASGDWFASRATQVHVLRRLASTRERVEIVSAAPDALVVQSTVGAVLRHFAYRDGDRRWWVAGEIAPGARVTLRPAPGGAPPRELAELIPGSGAGNTFYALADRSETGLVPTLKSIRWRDDLVVFTGRLAQPAPKP